MNQSSLTGIYDRYDHLLVSSCFGVCFFGIGLDASGRIWTHLDAFWTHLEALGGIGLTVALFVANEAFVQPEMRGQATGPS